jgi:cytochrome c biogenesis protein ResB
MIQHSCWFLLLLVAVSAHAGCGYDRMLARTREMEREQGYLFERKIHDIGHSFRKEQEVSYKSMNLQFYTGYILNDVEQRTCYEANQV